MRPLLLLAAALLGSVEAQAADPAKMAGFEKTLVTQLEQLDNHLERGASSSGASSLKSALGLVDDVERTINAYATAAKGDRAGETNVKEWKYIVAQVESALKDLVVIQARQFEQDAAPKVCVDAEKKLLKDIDMQVRAVSGKPEKEVAEAIKEIKADAEALKKMVSGGVVKFDENLKLIGRKAAELKGFRANNDVWGKVDDELGLQAAGILDHYQDANRKVHSACAKVMEGEDNPDVRAVILKLERGLKTTRDAAAEAVENHENWLRRLKVIRKWHEEGEEAIRKALCASDEGPDDVVVLDPVEDVVKDVVQRLDAEWALIEREGLDLKQHLQDARLVADVTRKLNSISRSLKSRLLLGANNPVIRTRMEIGKTEHNKQQDKLCPRTREITLPNKKRIDCVIVKGTTCDIVEIKPDTVSGKQRALPEAQAYRDMVQGYFDNDKTPSLFDDASQDLKVFKPCIVGNKINLHAVAVTYEFCPSTLDVDATAGWDLD